MQAVVVTTQLGGVPESIPEAMTRFSVPERNASALAEAIIAVYDLPESELECLGRVGRDFVMRGYDIRKLNEQMIAVLCR